MVEHGRTILTTSFRHAILATVLHSVRRKTCLVVSSGRSVKVKRRSFNSWLLLTISANTLWQSAKKRRKEVVGTVFLTLHPHFIINTNHSSTISFLPSPSVSLISTILLMCARFIISRCLYDLMFLMAWRLARLGLLMLLYLLFFLQIWKHD